MFRLLSKPCTRKYGDGVAGCLSLDGSDEVCGYFVFQRDHEVTPAEDPIIRGILNVFSNYFACLKPASRDRLTGLLNRQTLENSFDRDLDASCPSKQRPGLALKGAGANANKYWLAVT